MFVPNISQINKVNYDRLTLISWCNVQVMSEVTRTRSWQFCRSSCWENTTVWLPPLLTSTPTGTTRPSTRKPGRSLLPSTNTSTTTSGCPSSSVIYLYLHCCYNKSILRGQQELWHPHGNASSLFVSTV